MEEEKTESRWGVVGALCLSVASSVSIVIVNKALMTNLQFQFGRFNKSSRGMKMCCFTNRPLCPLKRTCVSFKSLIPYGTSYRVDIILELFASIKGLPKTSHKSEAERLLEAVKMDNVGPNSPHDFNVDDDLLLALNKLHVVCFVNKYDRPTIGNPGSPGLRSSVVKTYAMDTITAVPTIPTTSNTTLEEPTFSKDKQLITPKIMKNLSDNEEITNNKEADHPSPSAKRYQDFISVNICKKNDAMLPVGEGSAHPSGGEESTNVEKNPVKKGRNKVK